ncbi:MAG: sorbosone dehydrogenase family protein [Trueperaceae bacterium]
MPYVRDVAIALASLLLIAAPPVRAQEAPPPAAPAGAIEYTLAPWLTGATLPVALATDPDGGDDVLIVELGGVVRSARAGVVRPAPFLDLRQRVTGLAGEQGLFTVALEPTAAAVDRPRQVVAAFTEIGTGDLIIAAYPVDLLAWTADATAEVVVFRVPMPEPFHHGGQVRFGPDGALYASIGNGERSSSFWATRPWSAQSLATLRGKLVRVRLLPTALASAPRPYTVPNDNPFVAADDPPEGPVHGEIWARGFRNPWKFAFDLQDGAALVADVGEDRWEEVSRVTSGGNYGWPIREGPECLEHPDVAALVEPACVSIPLDGPWIAYGHPDLDPGGGLAVTGGVVVADPELPDLMGRYVFGDFVTGRVWAWDEEAGRRDVLLDSGLALTAIDAGPAGEVLLVALDGRVLRLRAEPFTGAAVQRVR